jgi:proteasome lid subunit RPN8/RPN11
VACQLVERPEGVLATVHTHKGASPRRNEVDRDNLAVLTESVAQFLLLNQFRQVPHPQRRTANCIKKIKKKIKQSR